MNRNMFANAMKLIEIRSPAFGGFTKFIEICRNWLRLLFVSKINFYRFLSISVSLFLFLASLTAVEIPLDIVSETSRKTSIAFVDMEVVYNVCQDKTKMGEEYAEAKKKFETEISSIAAAIQRQKDLIETLTKEIEEMKAIESAGAAISTEALAAESSTAAVQSVYEKELNKKLITAAMAQNEKDLAALKEKMASELASLEKFCVMNILERIYKVLEQIAKEEELTLIIDKNYILYGPAGYDITHKVIERLK